MLPQRIVCLTDETTETIYRLGEQHRIVGISSWTKRPAGVEKEKPIVTSFTSARIDKIVQLNPDLVLGFSDLQAEMTAELVKAGIEAHVFNQRSVAGILGMIRTVGALLGCQSKASLLIEQLTTGIDNIRRSVDHNRRRPRVYFEEWNEPIITGIQWVSELIELAGGTDCFADFAMRPFAAERIIADSREVLQRNPDIIIASWCGKKANLPEIAGRPGWEQAAAILNNRLYEIDSSIILQPGPAALTDGLTELRRIVQLWEATCLSD